MLSKALIRWSRFHKYFDLSFSGREMSTNITFYRLLHSKRNGRLNRIPLLTHQNLSQSLRVYEYIRQEEIAENIKVKL